MKFLSLFSGIGGLDLGLERAGMTCVGQVELDPFCRAVLAKHWTYVPRMEDVRSVNGDEFGPVDLVCGGVPCQPASCAGKRKGADDDRWLWPEFSRIVRATRCSWFLAENVRGFLSLPVAGGVVRDLEGAGYEVRTVLLGAHHVGAPHRRDRIWIVGRLADASGARLEERRNGTSGPGSKLTVSAGSGGTRWPSRPGEPQHEWEAPRLVYAERNARRSGNGEQERGSQGGTAASGTGGRESQSRLGCPASRLPRRLAGFARRSSLKALGNAVVPAVAQVVGEAIMGSEVSA